MPWGGHYDLVVRDGKTGFIFFNIEGAGIRLQSERHSCSACPDRTTADLERVCRRTRTSVRCRHRRWTDFDQGNYAPDRGHARSLTAKSQSACCCPSNPETGSVPGPDVIVGDLSGLAQFGSQSGTQVGLAVGTDSCNFGTVNLQLVCQPGQRPPGDPAKSLSNERRRDQR